MSTTTTTEERSPCRDFERGVCNRGDKCKYYHPEGSVAGSENGKLPICKDFQNKGCGRIKCKFLHITVDEEAEYNKSGALPEHGGRPEKNAARISFQGKEVCKDFLNNICDRGANCRYMHVSERELQLDITGANGATPCPGGGILGTLYGKRRRDEFGGGSVGDASVLMDENEMLKRKITDLQKEVIDLREVNDTLYDQNTRYRTQLRGSTALTDVVSQQASDVYTKAAAGFTAAARVSAATAPTVPATVMMPQRPAYDYSQLSY